MKGKIALVTGASRGIGKEIALTLAKRGADVLINDIEPMKEEAEKTVKELEALGVKSAFFAADVSNYESVEKMVGLIKDKFEKVDILVNNAGITKDRTLKKMSADEWNAVININLNGMFNVTKNIIKIMPDGGRIVGISSIVALGGNFGQCNYSAAKAGMVGFTKSLSKELAKNKITVNAVAPGFIKTAMTDKIPLLVREQILEIIPMREMGTADDVANTVAFFASEDAKYITGQVLRIDGGLQM